MPYRKYASGSIALSSIATITVIPENSLTWQEAEGSSSFVVVKEHPILVAASCGWWIDWRIASSLGRVPPDVQRWYGAMWNIRRLLVSKLRDCDIIATTPNQRGARNSSLSIDHRSSRRVACAAVTVCLPTGRLKFTFIDFCFRAMDSGQNFPDNFNKIGFWLHPSSNFAQIIYLPICQLNTHFAFKCFQFDVYYSNYLLIIFSDWRRD